MRAANPDGAVHSQRSARSEDRGRARRRFSSPTTRRAAALTPPWANGRRAKEYRVGDGPPADRRHLQRRPRGAVSLEGLGAERAGDPAVGRRGHGQRHAAVGDEVLRRALRPPLAAGRSSGSTTGTSATSAICATRRRSPASRCCTRSRPPTYHGGMAHGRSSRRSHARACITRWSRARVPFELVHEAFLTPDRLDRFKLLILADAAALSDAQCARAFATTSSAAAACSPRSPRRSTTRAAAQRPDFGLADCSACRSPAASTARCRTRT